MTTPRVLLLPAGSAGDVNPFAGLARELARRGHAVTVACNAHFRHLFEIRGVESVEMGDAALFEEAVRHPDLWRDGPASLRVVMRFAAIGLRPLHDLVREFVRQPDAVVVAGVLALGARTARDTTRFPLVTVQLAPAGLPSVEQPARLPGSPLRAWMPHWLKAVLWAVTDRFADRLSPELVAFRHDLGLEPVRGLITQWANSPDCVLGLFPPWFAAPPPDWPAQTRLTGFPLWDGERDRPLDDRVEGWLAGLGGARPLVFAPGSANAQAAPFFAAAASACERLGLPGLLLTPYAEQAPARLPARVARFDYVPLSRLLARSAALVSHGGIGTVSQALAAGCPQLVMPMAFDQHDNTARLRALGVARRLPLRPSADRLTRGLGRLLEDEAVARAARACAARVQADGDALARSCDVIETMVAHRPARTAGRPGR